MADLQAIFDVISHLSPEELEQVRQYVEEQQKPRIIRATGTPKERIAALRQAQKKFREGFTDEELHEITQAMNAEYLNPKALSQYNNWDEDAEDES
jgi:tyrosyl-tRNA synthetase